MSATVFSDPLTPAISKLREWVLGDVLPVWLDPAHDPASGHFHEGLGLDGTVGRMIHVYADAARLGLGPPGGLAAARADGEALERDARLLGGGYAHEIARRSGEIRFARANELGPCRQAGNTSRCVQQSCALPQLS